MLPGARTPAPGIIAERVIPGFITGGGSWDAGATDGESGGRGGGEGMKMFCWTVASAMASRRRLYGTEMWVKLCKRVKELTRFHPAVFVLCSLRLSSRVRVVRGSER